MRTASRRTSVLLTAIIASLPSAAHAQHPHLYFDAAGREALRARAADDHAIDGWSFAELYAGFVAQGEGLLAQPFVYTVAVPDADGDGSVPWTYPLSTSLPPPHPNNAGYPTWTGLASRLTAHVEVLSMLYAIDGDERWLRDPEGVGAVDVALAVSAWSTWNDPEYPCGGGACLDTAHLTLGMSLVYDLAYDALTEPERAALRGALISRGIFPLSASVSTSGAPHNIHALRATALAVGAAAVHTESGATPHFARAHEGLTHFLDSQGADGGALEGSLYGTFAMDTMVRAAIALERKTELPSLFEHPWVAGLPRFTTAFLGTDGTSVNFGDASLARYWSLSMFALASRGSTGAQWYVEHVLDGRPNSWLSFVLARTDLEGVVPWPGAGGALYPETGYAALRSGFDGAPVLMMKSGPRTTVVGHNHLDHNSFVVSAFGQWLAADPGYRDYFNVPRRNYSTGSVGHNTMLVDGSVSADGRTVRGGQTQLAGGQLRHHWEGAAYSRVIGDAAAAYPAGLLEGFTRRVYYARPDVFFVFDEVSAPAAHQYSFLLHADASSEVSRMERDTASGALAGYRAAGARGELQSFAVASVGWQADAPRVQGFPNVPAQAPYAEWRTTSAARAAATMVLVPVARTRSEIVNAGFEEGIRGWTPRSAADDVQDATVAHSGTSSGRVRRSAGTGYFYSSIIATEEGRTITGGTWVRATGTGTVTLTPYFLESAAYLPEPQGMAATRDAATLGEWTWVPIPEQLAPAIADGARLSLAFTGTGTAWFDDVVLTSAPGGGAGDPDPRAFALGDPPAGIVIETGRGLDVGLSFLGDARTPADTVLRSSGPIGEVQTDAVLALFGLDADGELARAYLQTGTWLRVDGEELVRSTIAGGYDLRVERVAGCVRLRVAQVETLEGAPFDVAVAADEVVLDGARVAFEPTERGVRFPVDGEAPRCAPVELDGGVPSDDDGGTARDGGDASVAPPATSGTCGCRAGGSRTGSASIALALLMLGALARRRRRAVR